MRWGRLVHHAPRWLRRGSLAWLPLLLLALPGASRAATSAEIKPVARDMVCLCGDCSRESLATCLCGFAQSERDRIGGALDDGQQQQQIIAQFVQEYGPVVLASPPAKGSNLLAWIAPILLLLVGIVLVRSVLLNWRRAPADEAAAEPATGGGGTGYEERLRRELDQYD